MTHALHHVVMLAVCAASVGPLARSRWPWHSPRVALLLWQALGLAAGLSAVSFLLAVGLSPYGRGVVPACAALVADVVAGQVFTALSLAHLVAVVVGLALAARLLVGAVASVSGTLRARRRHRSLLTLLGRDTPDGDDVLLVDLPTAAAYCVPGRHPRVVISTATRRLLDDNQLRAVLAHERAHAHERHDLILLPFTLLRRALPNSRLLAEAARAVAMLVEMRADDRALARHRPETLAGALLCFHPGGPTAPGGAAPASHEIQARVRRLLTPRRPLSAGVRALLVVTAALLALTPASLLVLPG
ncbi:M56 family metallopeptidase [Streptoalloteichus hindustanus]|uniref:Peptidase family M48 n=1 Tax=Streptoalloteichus hindustanus TaxID=2017 RepID=A0A1M5PPN2_STRHI|nr:M56 family metallopeptidase [Streptoalloteichus hindustanus]SHH03661.1 Peptidase family M48 [Streptoalloteichus hindustanus]